MIRLIQETRIPAFIRKGTAMGRLPLWSVQLGKQARAVCVLQLSVSWGLGEESWVRGLLPLTPHSLLRIPGQHSVHPKSH